MEKIPQSKENTINKASELFDLLRKRNIPALGKAITLLESSLPEQRKVADDLLRLCLPHSGNSVRIGVSGIPGAGKSTFIDAIGQLYLKDQHSIAVLAIDPSSNISGGSILGDKTRMEKLSREADVFIRPSPTSGSLGGVARSTRESVVICEAAGFDTIIIETVGVGQSETAVHSMTDLFVMLAIPGAGDELQGIKRGIMEMADIIVINKAEGENRPRAESAARQLQNALHLFPKPHNEKVEVLLCSALSNEGILEVYNELNSIIRSRKGSDMLENRRRQQSAYWLKEAIESNLLSGFFDHPEIKSAYARVRQEVEEGSMNPFDGASHLITLFKSLKD